MRTRTAQLSHSTITSVVAALLVTLGLIIAEANAQRAVIIIDGERTEIDFDEADALREHIQQQLQLREPADVGRERWPQNSQNVNVNLPDDDELRRIEIRSDLLALADDLNSDSFATREAATAELIDAEFENLQFYALLARDDLSVEQRSRLLMVVRQRLIHAPRGAVGISMRPAMNAPDGRTHIVVTDLIEGLPAERVLKVDDRITHLNGNGLRSPEDLTMEVQSRRPGERITLTVLRPKRDDRGMLLRQGEEIVDEELEIELTLGSAELLNQARGNQFAQNRSVDRLRQQKANTVLHRFRPRHAEAELDPQLFAIDLESASEERMRRLIDHHVEQHLVIREIRRQRGIIEEMGRPVPNALREEWKLIEARLAEELENEDLPVEQRYILEGVLERFRELTAD